MPCDSQLNPGQSQEARLREIQAAIKRLAAGLGNGSVAVNIGPQGAIAFTGWENRDRVSDVCAYRALMLANSFDLKQAVARAEAMSGRKLNPQAVGQGTHSHDGGHTWHAGH